MSLFAFSRRALAAAVLAACSAVAGPARAADDTRVLPAPVRDEPAGNGPETIVLAGGCFWGVQGVFQHVRGVSSAISGYAGGEKATAHYEITGRGDTGHAESVARHLRSAEDQPRAHSQIYFPWPMTRPNSTGKDRTTEHNIARRSPRNEEQTGCRQGLHRPAQPASFPAAIATTIEPGRAFYPAEAYHQDFLALNPTHPYIVINDLPKIEHLKRLYPTDYRAEPALAGGGRS